MSFLGNVALERFRDDKGEQSYMRVDVNGLAGSCKMETFQGWVNARVERWGDWASVCEIKGKTVIE